MPGYKLPDNNVKDVTRPNLSDSRPDDSAEQVIWVQLTTEKKDGDTDVTDGLNVLQRIGTILDVRVETEVKGNKLFNIAFVQVRMQRILIRWYFTNQLTVTDRF